MQRRCGRTHKKVGRSQKKFGCACKGYATIGTKNATKNRETLRYLIFDRRQAARNGIGNTPEASDLNPRLNGNRCISTKNKKIAVTVTLYQNNRDSVARFGYMDTMQPFSVKLCAIFAIFAR